MKTFPFRPHLPSALLMVLLSLALLRPLRAQQSYGSNVPQGSRLNIGQVVLDSVSPHPYVLALKNVGVARTRQTVLLKVRPAGDSLYYTLPGRLPGGNSFGVVLIRGNRYSGDSLCLVRRSGTQTVRLTDVHLLTFHYKDRLLLPWPDRKFNEALLASYFDSRTMRSALK